MNIRKLTLTAALAVTAIVAHAGSAAAQVTVGPAGVQIGGSNGNGVLVPFNGGVSNPIITTPNGAYQPSTGQVYTTGPVAGTVYGSPYTSNYYSSNGTVYSQPYTSGYVTSNGTWVSQPTYSYVTSSGRVVTGAVARQQTGFVSPRGTVYYSTPRTMRYFR